jgi:hypothetical protein
MKVAICIPRYGDTKGEFTISLARMIVYSLSQPSSRPLQIEIFSATSSDLPGNRTELLKCAIQWQARYLLWLDCDHVFPPDTLMRLLEHALPVVGCNQPRRTNPTGPVAVRLKADGKMEHVYTTEQAAKAGLVEQVYHVGLALCLMDMNVLHQVKAHVEAQGDGGWALWEPFNRKLIPGSNARMGEDVSFFRELTDAGVAVYVDHGLSWEVGHIADRILTNADTVAQQELWLSRNS